MEIIKKITFLAMLTMGSISCNKTNTITPADTTVIGTWKLNNIQGNITTTVGTKTDVFATSYNNIDKTKSQKMNNDASEIYPYTLLLDIKASQVLSVTETRVQDKSYNDTYTGTWSKNTADNTLMLMGFENTDFYGDFESNKFVITSATATSLILSYSNIATSGTPAKIVKTAYTLTFSK